jgi:hypothetical protein
MASVLLLSLAACNGDESGGDGGGGSMMAAGGGGGAAGAGMGNGALGRANPPPIPAANRIDRIGRPAITAALISAFAPDTQAADRDAYNRAGLNDASFQATMKTSLGILDGLDEVCGNQLLAGDGDNRYQALTDVLLDDQLYVNLNEGVCGTYLGLEGGVAGQCGGRTPLDDVVERSYSVLATGDLVGFDDTITEDDATHDPAVFPFLAAP